MADLKISAATPNPAPAGTDNFATDKAGVDFRTSLAQIQAFIGSGFGDVFKVGTPLNNQLGVWTGDGTIEGTDQWQVVGAALQGVLGSGPELRNVAGVNIHPRKGDTDTGIASRGDNRLAMVAQGIDGIKLIGASSAILQQHNTTVGITAFAGGGSASATQLNSSYSVIDTVVTTGDSVKFSTTLEVGVVNYVKNDGANAMDLFPAGGDDLGFGIGVAISVGAGKSVAFIGTVTGSVSTQFIFQEVSGDLTKVGTPLINQIAVWDGDGPVRGDPNFLLSGTQLILPSGTSAGLPELKVGPGQTGFFSGSSAQLRVTVNGIERFTFTNAVFQGFLAGSGQLHNRVSSFTVPTFTPNTNDDNTGIGGNGADLLSGIAGGSEVWRAGVGGGNTQFQVTDGIVTSPGLVFITDLNTGLARLADDAVSLVGGGVELLRATETGNSDTDQIFLPRDGSAAAPALAFGSTGNGIFFGGVAQFNLAIAGASVFFINNSALSMMGSIGVSLAAGPRMLQETPSATNPVINVRQNDADTGLGSVALGSISQISDGVESTRTVLASAGGLQANNTLTGAGLERVLTEGDIQVVQTSNVLDSAVATGTGLIPVDDTIPQITEGDEYMTLVHTPLDAANILIITVGMYLEGNSRMSIGLFKDAVANALSATNHRGDDGDAKFMHFRTQVVAGGTAAITFRLRAGSSTAGTTTFNGISGARIFGGVMASSLSIIEVTP